MTLSRSWSAAIVALGLVFIAPLERNGHRAASPPGPYVLTDLGTLGGGSAQAYDINEAGQIVGYSTTAQSRGHAFLWQNGVMTDLGTLGGPYADASAINNAGQVVGRSGVTANGILHATLWQNGAAIQLVPGNDGSTATAINDAGQIAGSIGYVSAFLWQNGVRTDLGQLGGGCAFAGGINDAGQVVGSSCTTNSTLLGGRAQHAFVWQNGVMTNLGVLPGEEESAASAINNLGQIVGTSMTTDPETYETRSRAFLYEGGAMTALPVPSSEAYASDINDAGQVVGTMVAAGFSRYSAYIYADGVVTNLNSLIPAGSGLHLSVALGINNGGQIVGWGYDSRYSYHAFLLTPVAPGTVTANVGDASVTEGHAGTRTASFTVTLSAAASAPVTISYSTANGTASAGDYESASGTLTFDAGETSKTISVSVNGDRAGEANETFLVDLTGASGAVIADGQAVGTIVDDEPRVSISDVSRSEGHSGTSQFVFTVNLSAASDVPVSLGFATANGSARAGEDYDARTGTVSFGAGERSKTIAVTVRGDRTYEGNETFYVNLSNAVGAFLANMPGTGVIRNDDR